MLRILVADGSPAAAAALSSLVTMWGHQAIEAYDTASALELASRFLPDVVLLDVGLPGAGGYETARRLRALPGVVGAVLVAVETEGRPLEPVPAHQAGFDLRVPRPVAPDELRQLLGCCEQ